jgi:hypothetical protein
VHLGGRVFSFFDLGARNALYVNNISKNNISWSKISTPRKCTDIYASSFAYGNGKYVLVACDGTVYSKMGNKIGDEGDWNASLALIPVMKALGTSSLDSIRIVYGSGMFLLSFITCDTSYYKSNTHLCTSPDAINWELKEKVIRLVEDEPYKLVGSPLGFTYISYSNRIYYSKFADHWIKVAPRKKFDKIFCPESLFLGGAFIALEDKGIALEGKGSGILLGIKSQNGGIKWIETKLNILSPTGELIDNSQITLIECDNKGTIIVAGRELFAQLN